MKGLNYTYHQIVQKEKEKFKEFCSTLNAYDFGNVIHIIHEDCSTFILHNAVMWKSEVLDEHEIPKFIGVSTEHNGDFFFFAGDLTSWRVLKNTIEY